LPIKFRKILAFGYAFINLVSKTQAERFRRHFSSFFKWGMPGGSMAEVEYSKDYQGLEQQVERYRNSPLLSSSAPDEMKPILLSHGVRVPFPAPTVTDMSCDATASLSGCSAQPVSKELQLPAQTRPRIRSWADCRDQSENDETSCPNASPCSTRCPSGEDTSPSPCAQSHPKLGRRARRTFRKLAQTFGNTNVQCHYAIADY
jgi:hypothetical protein